MESKLDEFKAFIKKHPLLKQDVISKKKTWQELYEDFVLLGEDGMVTNTPSTEKKIEKKEGSTQVTKTVTSIQKVLELFGSFGASSTAGALAKKSTGDPLFDKRFDEWY